MNKAAKVVIVLLNIFTLLTLEACSAQDKKAAEKITEVLKKKYEEEFAVDRIGGRYGTLTTNTIKAIVYPKKDPYKKFDVEMTKDLNTVWDSYMNVVMSEKLDKELLSVVHENANEKIKIKTYLTANSVLSPDQTIIDQSLPVLDYLDEKTDVSIYFFFENESTKDPNVEAEKIHLLAESILKYGLKNAFIWVFYMKSEPFNKIGEDKKLLYNHSQAFKFFSKKDNSDHYSWVQIEDSGISQTAKDIKNNFK